MTATELLIATEHYDTTYSRWLAHVAACRNLGCTELMEPFERFASEVMSTPERHRADLLAETPLPAYEPRRSFPVYETPRNSGKS